MTRPAPLPSAAADPFADRRLHPRVAVALPAFLIVAGQRHSVQIVDLSAGGAKLRGELPPIAGTRVGLDFGSGPSEGSARWQDGPFVGLSFTTALSEREVAALADRSAALVARMRG
ncbi:hypothetical protein GCM10022280_01820 [Sphingomonas swuensis]|uniref:PilZ domain-containing protein n=1 Tax=Sphingomonas swuensis TaxID=977800 RepID=A0ABP7S9H7_9SPHN